MWLLTVVKRKVSWYDTPPRVLYSSYNPIPKISIKPFARKIEKDMWLKHLAVSFVSEFDREMLPLRCAL